MEILYREGERFFYLIWLICCKIAEKLLWRVKQWKFHKKLLFFKKVWLSLYRQNKSIRQQIEKICLQENWMYNHDEVDLKAQEQFFRQNYKVSCITYPKKKRKNTFFAGKKLVLIPKFHNELVSSCFQWMCFQKRELGVKYQFFAKVVKIYTFCFFKSLDFWII